jgi:hypothetical protein
VLRGEYVDGKSGDLREGDSGGLKEMGSGGLKGRKKVKLLVVKWERVV